ncbi:MAG TPA: hypothetical protein VG672_28820, partial [Bryobacteraceae bacterium]|nr:hypothetical protein [Bryobacteraceae bacterium]
LLRDSDYSLKKQAAPGVDGMTWEEYGGDLEARLADLHGRIHRGAYRANLYLHYVLDIWVQAWRKKVAHGEVMIVRYADDGAPRAQRAEEGPMCVTV